MALIPDQKREIAQLMFVARHYLLHLASAAPQRSMPMGATKDKFKLAGALARSTRSDTIVNAYLASAAIRLASVDDVLCAAGLPRTAYQECRKYFARSANATRDARGSTCSEWFHIMLRDAIGHAEPDQSPTVEQKKRYRDRQNCIEKTPLRLTPGFVRPQSN